MSRASILSAFTTQLATSDVSVERNIALPISIPAGGLIIVRDGDAGEPTTYIGRPRPIEQFEHTLDVEIYVQLPDDIEDLYGIIDKIGDALRANPSLGGLVQSILIKSPNVEAIQQEGGSVVLAALLPITLSYLLPRAA